ncbi:tRNA (guanosine(46)-N7)-methyltransferase TrmB [Catalinimonas sp. 4WD22]|uniref:tRNA (guanosine(46)-N7)-methyltransferase TrmB n=1 Tax=Catalinimonas locisalis TaxID=3133978 RepID=UPI00310139E2
MRSKLSRFKDNEERKNIIQPGKPICDTIKGKWQQFFENDHPIVFELGCGRGEYTVGLARRFPDTNYVGVDVKGARIWKGSSAAIEEGLDNVAFLRIRILEIEKYVEENELNEIWITFPDPRPKKRDIKRRLTSERFMDIYKKLLKPEGIVHFKTDNAALFDFTLELLKARNDVINLESTFDYHSSKFKEELPDIVTKYEAKFMSEGEEIKYLRFNFAKE